MTVTKQDLITFGLFDNLPQALKEMTDGYYFVFYYNDDEASLKLNVYEFSVVAEKNISLYRGMQSIALKHNLTSAPKVGVFENTFESRDGLFFKFLKTYNDEEKVFSFYRFAKSKDEVIDFNVSTDSVNEVYNSQDFRKAISYFSEMSLQSVMLVYDMVDDAFKRKLQKSLYGGTIKKTVNLVKYNGGVLSEINGRLRFMVIGENANLTEEQQTKLKEAKLLVRSLEVSMEDIYLHTGWAMGDKDGKWRTNIADDSAEISDVHLLNYNDRKLYIPSKTTPTNEDIQQVLGLLNNPEKMYALNYGGQLIDVLNHPTLYQYYPQLAITPLLYYYGKKTIIQGGQPVEMLYNNNNQRGGYTVINGSEISGNPLSILLHETQHAIQGIEGFARGGNDFLARFVATVGSSSVRKIFACINRMEKYFKEYLLNDESRMRLLELFNNELPKNKSAEQLKATILNFLSSNESYFNSYNSINFYLILYLSEEDNLTGDLVVFLQEKFGDIIYELFENVSAGYESAKNYISQLKSEGYRQEDISNILFKGYENLYGELESRSVQESRLISSEFKNYFSLTRWENAPIQEITVIDGVDKIIDCSKIEAAVEDKDGNYILHFKRGFSCVPFLHELGHIVKDALCELGYSEQIEEAADREFEDVEEFFVSKWLAFLKANINEDALQEDLRYDFTPNNAVIDEILQNFFTKGEENESEMMKYLRNMLSN